MVILCFLCETFRCHSLFKQFKHPNVQLSLIFTGKVVNSVGIASKSICFLSETYKVESMLKLSNVRLSLNFDCSILWTQLDTPV